MHEINANPKKKAARKLLLLRSSILLKLKAFMATFKTRAGLQHAHENFFLTFEN